MNKSVYIYGASGHGLVVADIARVCGYDEVIFIDDGDNEYLTFEELDIKEKVDFALGVGDNKTREKLFKKIVAKGYNIVSLKHPNAIISQSVKIGKGVVVMPNVVINARAIIQDGVILNTACVVEHECKIKSFTHISPNVALAGNVNIGELSHIGIGASIIQNITIGKNCIIGAGSIVVENIENNLLCYGNPCRILKEIDWENKYS